MLDDFMVRALLGGLGVALVAGPLGSFMVWRRMAYFGETMAHSALLGVALGLMLSVNITIMVVAVCALLAILLVALQRQRHLTSDTLLGILSHSALSLGLVALAFMESVRVDLMGLLFGDILTTTRADLLWIYGSGSIAIMLIIALWRPLLSLSVHEEIAQVEGVAVTKIKLVFMVLIATVIAVAMKIVGILLITSLLIIPPATARYFARSPEQMAFLAAVLGCLAIGVGLLGSVTWDIPAGPAIVVSAALLFVLSNLLFGRQRNH